MSIAEFFGWTFQNSATKGSKEAECMACGEAMTQQRESVMYECERCMNLQNE